MIYHFPQECLFRPHNLSTINVLRPYFMKQILQDARSGVVSVYDVPAPAVQRGHIQVRTAASLISAGTEKVVVDSGKKSLLGRAKERPDLVKQVLDKVRTEGLLKTYAAVQTKLEGKTALGTVRPELSPYSARG